MRNILIFDLVSRLGSGGFFLWKSWDKNRLQEERPKHPTTAVVERKDIRFTVTVAGEIGPAEQVSVRPEINGRIDKLLVDIGDKVAKGSLLFTLDDKDLQIEIATRETEIASAKLQLDKAKRDFETDEKLFTAQLVSKETYENSRTDYELAKKGIERADRTLDLAKDRLSKTKIVAPFDCTILNASGFRRPSGFRFGRLQQRHGGPHHCEFERDDHPGARKPGGRHSPQSRPGGERSGGSGAGTQGQRNGRADRTASDH
jgi:multidrug efflux pump subunit AcrA (membrane-fusion protein)